MVEYDLQRQFVELLLVLYRGLEEIYKVSN